MADITLQQYIDKLECQKKALENFIPFGLAVQSVHELAVTRIFVDGKNSQNEKIGEYSKKPLYVSMVDKTKSPKKLEPVGKTGKKIFKSGKSHTSRYFTSYKDFKEQIGRRGFVNLTLFGNLKSNFANGSRQNIGEGTARIEARKISDREYVVGLDSENSDKKEGLELHFGGTPIFINSRHELDELKRIQEEELINTLTKC